MSEQEHEIEWSKPPPKKAGGGRKSKYRWFYDLIAENPGREAKFPGAVSTANAYAKDHEGFEVTTRVIDGEQVAWMWFEKQDA